MGLSDIFQDIADAIRTKTGKSESIYPVDMASEIEGISSGGGYKLEKMPSGAVSSFNDGTDLPLNKLKVSIEPVQDLHGYDHPWPAGGGKNLLDINSIVVGNTTNWSVDVNGDTLTVTHKTEYVTGTPAFAFNQPSGTYVVSISSINTTGQVSLYVNGAWAKTLNNGNTFTIDAANTNEIRFSAQGNLPTIITKIQIESGSTATAYEPYSNICPITGWDECNVNVSPTTSAEDGTTYTIQFKNGDNPLTVYGGTLDVTSGELTVTDAYIASYNAETLPSTWISDRDVYAEGTAPTTGAEVVYKLANSATYYLTPVQIRTFVGNNNIWADTGDIINGEYFKGAESGGGGIKAIEGTTTQQGFFNIETEVKND